MSGAGAADSLQIQAPAPVWELSLRQEGRLLCALLAGTRLDRWSCADGKLLSDVTYQGPRLTAGAIAPRGDRLAIATVEPAVKVVDASGFAPVAAMQAPPSRCEGLTWSSDGAFLAGFSSRRRLELRIWTAGTGAPLASFTDPAMEPDEIAFHPAGRLAAVSVLTGDILLLDLGASRPIRTLSDARMACDALAFSPDGSALIAASLDGALLVWDTRDWKMRRLEGIPGAGALAVSPDGALVALVRRSFNPPDTPAEVRLVNLRSGRTLARQTLGISVPAAVTFAEPGRARVATARDASIQIRTVGG